MVFNIIVGFILPWIYGLYLLKRNFYLTVIIFTFASLANFVMNVIFSLHYKFWTIEPKSLGIIASLPYLLGLYPLAACAFTDFVKKIQLNPLFAPVLTAIFLTIIEYIGLSVHRIVHVEQWNILWTLIAYFIPNILTFYYYNWVSKKMPVVVP